MKKTIIFSLWITILLSLIPSGDASSSPDKIYVIITVDVEDNHGDRILDDLVWGKSDTGDLYGITKIMDICESYGVQATFFVDVYEWKPYGEEAMKKVCVTIKERGHDIQLHTHPARAFDPQRKWMYQYSLSEQNQIIKEGCQFLHKWIGEYPIAHRAGTYGANYDTLKALKENHIFVDSSMYFSHEKCKLNNPPLTHNGIVLYDGIMEIPVTVLFNGGSKITLSPITLKKSEYRYKKVDIDSLTHDELISSLAEAKKVGLRTVVVFMHSWSLIKTPRVWSNFDPSHIFPDEDDISELASVIKYVKKDDDMEIVTIKQFYELYKEHPEIIQGTNSVLFANEGIWINQNLFHWAFKNFHGSIIAKTVVILTFLFPILLSCIVISIWYFNKKAAAKYGS